MSWHRFMTGLGPRPLRPLGKPYAQRSARTLHFTWLTLPQASPHSGFSEKPRAEDGGNEWCVDKGVRVVHLHLCTVVAQRTWSPRQRSARVLRRLRQAVLICGTVARQLVASWPQSRTTQSMRARKSSALAVRQKVATAFLTEISGKVYGTSRTFSKVNKQ